MLHPCRAGLRLVLLAATLLLTACSAPPDKELNQALGALDAARAAGAEDYAPEEYESAREALERYQEAVGQRDYRLALNHALDAREWAQEAAKQAAARKAVVRSEAERAVAVVAAATMLAEERLEAARLARVPAGELADARQAIADAGMSLQEARAALGQEEYLAARAALDGVNGRLADASRQVDALIAARETRRRR